MRLGYVKGENGKLVCKWVKEGEEKNPDVLFRVAAQFGDYAVTDEEHMEEAKAALLEQMLNAVRGLSKKDEFWIVKKLEDNKCTVAWKFDLPQMEGYYTYDVAEKIQKQLAECCAAE